VKIKNIDFPCDQFKKGLVVESEHAATIKGNPVTLGRIVLDHLDEDLNYYDKLAKTESRFSPAFSAKGCEKGFKKKDLKKVS
jgi:hypothetical protein